MQTYLSLRSADQQLAVLDMAVQGLLVGPVVKRLGDRTTMVVGLGFGAVTTKTITREQFGRDGVVHAAIVGVAGWLRDPNEWLKFIRII